MPDFDRHFHLDAQAADGPAYPAEETVRAERAAAEMRDAAAGRANSPQPSALAPANGLSRPPEHWQPRDAPAGDPKATRSEWAYFDGSHSERGYAERPYAERPYAGRGKLSRRGASSIIQGLITLLMLVTTLAAARFLVPEIIEESRYAWRRGQLRAEYEQSDASLRNVGLDALSNAYQMVTQRVGASVVHIEVQRGQTGPQQAFRAIHRGGMEPPELRDQGSGVIIAADGYILTNHHVIAEGDAITVGLSDGRRVAATVVGSDPLTDVALLHIDAPDLLPIAWGDSDQAEVGTPVWAVGSPFGLDRTVTFGILSGKHRAAQAGTSYQDFMQSDVAVNPGNSGGPLVNSRGQLIGINTAIVGDTYRGVSFSIPSNVARRVVERLQSNGRFERGWLGVQLAEVPDELFAGGNWRVRGALVSGLADPQSPAARSGIASGDIIVGFDGAEVADMAALMRMVGNWPSGQIAKIEVLREGQRRTIDVEIGARPTEFSMR